MITLLGTGLLGSGFARALARKGETVRVWNRTAAKARALAGDNITAFDDPAEAVRGAARTHLVLADDAAVDAVLAQAAVPAGALVIDHSTTSPAGAIARTDTWRARGVMYLHAPVFMGPQNALDSTGLMFVSGDREVVAKVTPLLVPMTGKVVDLGPRVDRAAAFKLLGNLILMALTAGFYDFIALARALGISAPEAGTLFEHFNPGPSLAGRYKRMTDADYDQPSWELAMARKDARLMQAEADRAHLAFVMLPGLAARMDAAIAEGDGHADWTVVAKELLR